MEQISAEELHDLLESGGVRVVDVRSPTAYARGHVPESENIPFGELTSRVEELEDAENVVMVCPRGEASVQAARLVESYEGFEGRVASLEPGIAGWKTDYGLETDGPGSDSETDMESLEAETEDAPF